MNGYLKKREPVILGLVETRLNINVELLNVGNGHYEMRRRDSNGKFGSGVVMLVKIGVVVEKVEVKT